jgi:hypothetical protein
MAEMRLRTLWDGGVRWLRHQPDLELGDGEPLVCAVCGAPAESWGYQSFMRKGNLVIEGVTLCADHERSRTRKAAG